MASDNRIILDLLRGQSQPHHDQGQQPLPPQQQQQQQGDMPPPSIPPHPFYHTMGPPPPMGQMMPGFVFGQQPIEQHGMYLPQVMHPQRPSMPQLPPGVPPQGRPPSHNNTLSLLQSLNQPAAVSPASTSVATFSNVSQAPQQHPPHQPQQFSPATLQATEDLRLALFGPPKQELTPAQQKTEDLRMALFGGLRPDPIQPLTSPKKEEINRLAVSAPLPAPPSETKQEAVAEIKPVEPKREVTKPTSSKETTPQPVSKPKFTYVNPFHSFTSTASVTSLASAAATVATPAVSTTTATTATTAPVSTTSPTHSRTGTPHAAAQENVTAGSLSNRSSFSTPVPRRENSTHTEPELVHHPNDDQKRYQPDQMLPPHSAWNHRVQKLAKGSSSIPDGVYLSHPGSGSTVYDTALENLDAIFSEDLEAIPITLISTDVEYHHGKIVAVSKGYISYAAKAGKIRVIQQAYGHRTLLRAHSDQVIDICFSPANPQETSGMQLLASVGKDSRVVIWGLSGSDADSTDIAHTKHLELIGTPRADQPRYSRVTWNPTNPNKLALVNNDDHSVFIFDVHNVVKSLTNDSPTVTEAQLLPHSIVIQAHSQAINDISFSRDGSVLLTASEDGSIKLWDVHTSSNEPTLLKEFEPHGGLGVTNAMFVDQPDASSSRFVVTACRRGTELGLWHAAGFGPLDQFVFKEAAPARRSSLGKSASRSQEMRTFNVMGYDPETSSLVLANSARLSLFGLKIKVTSPDNGSASVTQDQVSYLRTSMALEEAPCTASFDFMIEYPMPQHIVSFVVMPDSSLEYNGFSVYCIQSGAVQQYIIKGLEPHDKNRCQTFVSAPPAKSAEPKSKASKAKTTTLPSNKGNDGTDASAAPKPEKDIVESGATVVPPESQEKDSEKSIKLHGPVINGAIAKLKAGKRNNAGESQAATEVPDKRDSSKTPASGRTGRKGSQDSISAPQQEGTASKKAQPLTADPKSSPESARASGKSSRQQQNRHQETVEASPAVEQTPIILSESGQITISTGELQSLLLAMEDRMSIRFEKKLNAELEQQYRKMDQDQISRQEVVLKMVSQTLTKNTEQLLVQTVHKEIQNVVVPSLNKVVGAAVERQLSRTINDTVAKALPSAIANAISENVERVMSGPAFVNNLTTQVATAIRSPIEDSFKDSFTKVLIPSYQKATQAMFQQLHGAFQSGIDDLALANSKDHSAIAALTATVQKIASTVDTIHNTQVVQAQSDPASGGHSRLDQHRRSVTSGLQRTPQGDDPAGTPGAGSRRSSQQTSVADSKQNLPTNQQNMSIAQQIAYGDFEGAFTQALSANDPNAVFLICSKVSPRSVFQQTSTNRTGTLSQPVLLALTHQLANDQLSQNLGMKLSWLHETVPRLDGKDPVIGEHLKGVLPTVHKRLEECYLELLTGGGEANPHIQTLEKLLRYIHTLRS